MLVLEIAFRIFGLPEIPASDDPLVDLHQLKPLFVRSDDGQRLQIPESRYNFFRPESFQASKPADEFRIFVLGGSTVQGRPFAVETAFSTWLELALNATDKSKRYEAINCGGISYASYRLAPILDEVLGYQPDLIVLYMGHNEFLEERTYENLKRVPRGLAQVARLISCLRTTQMLRQLIRSDSQPSEEGKWVAEAEVRTRLDIAGGLADFHRDADWRADVIAHFEMTLRRMIRRCEAVGVPVMVCVPASDIVDTAPFKVQPNPKLSPGEAKEVALQWSIVTNSENGAEERMLACEQVLALDPRHAGAAFVLGRLLLEQNDFEAAKRWLVVARDHDVCPLRAPTEIQQLVRVVAKEHEVACVDVADLLDRLDPHELPGLRYFVDHVHPTPESHQKIALWLLQEMQAMGIVETDGSSGLKIEKAFAEHYSGLGEDYFLRGKQRLEGLRQWAAGRAGEMSVD